MKNENGRNHTALEDGLTAALRSVELGWIDYSLPRKIQKNAAAAPLKAIDALVSLRKFEALAGEVAHRLSHMMTGMTSIKWGAEENVQLVTSMAQHHYSEPYALISAVFAGAKEEASRMIDAIAASSHPERAVMVGMAYHEYGESSLEQVKTALETIATREAAEQLLMIGETYDMFDKVLPSVAKIGTREAAVALVHFARYSPRLNQEDVTLTLTQFPQEATVSAICFMNIGNAGKLVSELEKIGSDEAVAQIGFIGKNANEARAQVLGALFNLRAQAVTAGRNDLSVHDDALRQVLNKMHDYDEIECMISLHEDMSPYVDAFRKADALKLTREPYAPLVERAVESIVAARAVKAGFATFDYHKPQNI